MASVAAKIARYRRLRLLISQSRHIRARWREVFDGCDISIRSVVRPTRLRPSEEASGGDGSSSSEGVAVTSFAAWQVTNRVLVCFEHKTVNPPTQDSVSLTSPQREEKNTLFDESADDDLLKLVSGGEADEEALSKSPMIRSTTTAESDELPGSDLAPQASAEEQAMVTALSAVRSNSGVAQVHILECFTSDASASLHATCEYRDASASQCDRDAHLLQGMYDSIHHESLSANETTSTSGSEARQQPHTEWDGVSLTLSVLEKRRERTAQHTATSGFIVSLRASLPNDCDPSEVKYAAAQRSKLDAAATRISTTTTTTNPTTADTTATATTSSAQVRRKRPTKRVQTAALSHNAKVAVKHSESSATAYDARSVPQRSDGEVFLAQEDKADISNAISHVIVQGTRTLDEMIVNELEMAQRELERFIAYVEKHTDTWDREAFYLSSLLSDQPLTGLSDSEKKSSSPLASFSSSSAERLKGSAPPFVVEGYGVVTFSTPHTQHSPQVVAMQGPSTAALRIPVKWSTSSASLSGKKSKTGVFVSGVVSISPHCTIGTSKGGVRRAVSLAEIKKRCTTGTDVDASGTAGSTGSAPDQQLQFLCVQHNDAYGNLDASFIPVSPARVVHAYPEPEHLPSTSMTAGTVLWPNVQQRVAALGSYAYRTASSFSYPPVGENLECTPARGIASDLVLYSQGVEKGLPASGSNQWTHAARKTNYVEPFPLSFARRRVVRSALWSGCQTRIPLQAEGPYAPSVHSVSGGSSRSEKTRTLASVVAIEDESAKLARAELSHYRKQFASQIPDFWLMLCDIREELRLAHTSFPAIEFRQEAVHNVPARLRQLANGEYGDVFFKTKVTAHWGADMRSEAEYDPEYDFQQYQQQRTNAPLQLQSQRHETSIAGPDSRPADDWLRTAHGPLRLLLRAVVDLYRGVFGPARVIPTLPLDHPNSRRGLDFLMYSWFSAPPQLRCFQINTTSAMRTLGITSMSPLLRHQQLKTFVQRLDSAQGKELANLRATDFKEGEDEVSDNSVLEDLAAGNDIYRTMLFYDILGQRVLFAETHAMTALDSLERMEQLAVRLNVMVDPMVVFPRAQLLPAKSTSTAGTVGGTRSRWLRRHRDLHPRSVDRSELSFLLEIVEEIFHFNEHLAKRSMMSRGVFRSRVTEPFHPIHMFFVPTAPLAAEQDGNDSAPVEGVLTMILQSQYSELGGEGHSAGTKGGKVRQFSAATHRASRSVGATCGLVEAAVECAASLLQQVWPSNAYLLRNIGTLHHLKLRSIEEVLRVAKQRHRPQLTVASKDGYPPFDPRFYHARQLLSELLQGTSARYDCRYTFDKLTGGVRCTLLLPSLAGHINNYYPSPATSQDDARGFRASTERPRFGFPLAVGYGMSKESAWVAAAVLAWKSNFPHTVEQFELLRDLTAYLRRPDVLCAMRCPLGVDIRMSYIDSSSHGSDVPWVADALCKWTITRRREATPGGATTTTTTAATDSSSASIATESAADVLLTCVHEDPSVAYSTCARWMLNVIRSIVRSMEVKRPSHAATPSETYEQVLEEEKDEDEDASVSDSSVDEAVRALLAVPMRNHPPTSLAPVIRFVSSASAHHKSTNAASHKDAFFYAFRQWNRQGNYEKSLIDALRGAASTMYGGKVTVHVNPAALRAKPGGDGAIQHYASPPTPSSQISAPDDVLLVFIRHPLQRGKSVAPPSVLSKMTLHDVRQHARGASDSNLGGLDVVHAIVSAMRVSVEKYATERTRNELKLLQRMLLRWADDVDRCERLVDGRKIEYLAKLAFGMQSTVNVTLVAKLEKGRISSAAQAHEASLIVHFPSLKRHRVPLTVMRAVSHSEEDVKSQLYMKLREWLFAQLLVGDDNQSASFPARNTTSPQPNHHIEPSN